MRWIEAESAMINVNGWSMFEIIFIVWPQSTKQPVIHTRQRETIAIGINTPEILLNRHPKTTRERTNIKGVSFVMSCFDIRSSSAFTTVGPARWYVFFLLVDFSAVSFRNVLISDTNCFRDSGPRLLTVAMMAVVLPFFEIILFRYTGSVSNCRLKMSIRERPC